MRWIVTAIALLLSQAATVGAQEPAPTADEGSAASDTVVEATARLTVGPFEFEPCAACTSSTFVMRAPEGPVQVLVVRGQDVDLGENAGHSFVAFSWYARGVSDGADGSLSVEGVRDLVGDSIAASAGVADRLAAAGTMTIGSTSVEAMAVTLGDGLTARVGAVAQSDGVLVVTSFVRASEPSVAGLTLMLETVTVSSASMDTL
jgi:hypothetical protein